MSWKHQLYEIFKAEKWAIQSPGWERGHMIYPQSFKVSLMHTNFVTRSQKNLMFWIFFAQALLLLFKKRRKVSGQKMRTAYRIVRMLKTYLGIYDFALMFDYYITAVKDVEASTANPFWVKFELFTILISYDIIVFVFDIYLDFFIEMMMLSSSFKFHAVFDVCSTDWPKKDSAFLSSIAFL